MFGMLKPGTGTDESRAFAFSIRDFSMTFTSLSMSIFFFFLSSTLDTGRTVDFRKAIVLGIKSVMGEQRLTSYHTFTTASLSSSPNALASLASFRTAEKKYSGTTTIEWNIAFQGILGQGPSA